MVSWGKRLKWGVVGLFPFLVWLVFTYPLVFNFTRSIFSDYLGDSVGTIARYRLGAILQPTDLAAPLSGWGPLLLSKVVNPTAVYNLTILLSFLGTFLGGFYFLSCLGFSFGLTFLGSAAFLLAPIRLWYSFEWANHAQWGIILVYLAFLVRLIRERSWPVGVIAGGLFGWLLMENYYHGFTIFWLTLLVLIFNYNRPSKSFRSLITFALSALIASSPFIYSLLAPSAGNQAISLTPRSLEDSFTYSARPWHYFIPDINHPVFGDAALRLHRWIWEHPPYYLTERFFPKEHTLFLGFTLLALSGYAFFRVLSKKTSARDRFYILLFSFLAGGMFIFSLPPYMALGGVKIYFPSFFLYSLVPSVRAYARFGPLVFICNTVIACFGLKFLLEKIPKKLRVALYFLPFTLVIFEFINFPPFHNTSLQTPPAYEWLASQSGDFTYLEYPHQIYYTSQFYQSEHGKEVLNPYQGSGTSAEVRELLLAIDGPEFASEFKKLNGRYIFFHRAKEESEKQKVAQSWGFPAWGTHGDSPKKDNLYFKDEQFFLEDARFRQVADFEEVVVFELSAF